MNFYKITRSILIILAGSCVILVSVVVPGIIANATPVKAGPPEIRVYFKLDPLLTQSLYMGERLVSPPTYYTTVQQGKKLTVEFEARRLDIVGDKKDVPATAVAADPASAAVSHAKGNRGKLTLRCGQQNGVTVNGGGLSKQLSIKTICEGDTIRAEISQ
jgi:hypothetical protein